MTVILPTIGRVVWYWPQDPVRSEQPNAAIVTHVNIDGTVNLAVFDKHGIARSRIDVRLRQEGEPGQESHYCEWMPYQIGQAKAANPPSDFGHAGTGGFR